MTTSDHQNRAPHREMPLPASEDEIRDMAKKYPTPFHIYDQPTIKDVCTRFYKAFDWTPSKQCNFLNFFAVKANPNPAIVRYLVEEMGMGCDCSSIGELILCEKLNVPGGKIMFTSNNTAFDEYRKAAELGAIINLDDYSQIACLEKALKTAGIPFPKLVSFRYNPGPRLTGNVIIGEPVEAKYGLTRNQLLDGYKRARELGVERFGLHTMVASNSTDATELIATVKELFELAVEIYETTGVPIEFCNFGGGIGVAYRPEQTPIDFAILGCEAKRLYEEIIEPKPEVHAALKSLYYECGRVVTGEAGFIVSRVTNLKDTYKRYVGVDATMADLMRPGMYGAYHHLTVVKDPNCDRSNLPDFNSVVGQSDYSIPDYSKGKKERMYDVTGSLCENNDKFAVDRVLNAEPEIGDIMMIHCTGAHGYSMGFNYNAKMRHAEVLRMGSGEYKQIRRAETMEDYFATVADQF